jgi:hypothetical protein
MVQIVRPAGNSQDCPVIPASYSWGIFCKYWDDFRYPSSDDLLVWSQQEDWFLYYGHHEIFEYGTRKS